jgi:DNA-binding PadR family transcriptional regulator
MDLSILELYILSLLDRGLRSKYELQRKGGVSLGSSTPALKRLKGAGLITEQEAKEATKRIRQILMLTTAGRRLARQDWRNHPDLEANLDVEAILRVIDIASYQAAPQYEVVDFLKAMASRRAHPIARGASLADGVTGLQEQLAAYRANAESVFLSQLAKSLSRSRKSATSTNPPRTKAKAGR